MAGRSTTRSRKTTKTGGTAVAERRRVLSASTLSGDSVHNPQGEDIGKIHELMIDVSSGHIAYAVLSFGGFMGVGDKLFAIPWRALTLDQQNECFVLHISKEQLEEAEGFDKNNWPDMSSEAWSTGIHERYGVSPYWE